MTFYDKRLSTDLALGVQVRFRDAIDVTLTGGGHRTTNQNWVDPLRQFSFGKTPKTRAEVRALNAFYLSVDRIAGEFRMRDPSDYEAARQQFATGDDSTGPFPLTDTYTDGGDSYVRTTTLPVSGTVSIWKDGVLLTETTDYTIDYATGLVTFVASVGAGLALEWLGEFDVRAAFSGPPQARSLAPDSGGGLFRIEGWPIEEVRV